MTDVSDLIEEAYGRALEVLRRCVTPHGFRASGQVPGYPQVWARDSMITALGAAVVGRFLRTRRGRSGTGDPWSAGGRWAV